MNRLTRHVSLLLLPLLCLSLPSAPAWAAIAFVQGKDVTEIDADATVAFTWTSNTTTGNFIACVIGWSDPTARALTGITDSQSNTYVLSAFTRKTEGAAIDVAIAYAMNITGGTTPTVTATWNGSSVIGHDLTCAEFSGLAASSVLDQATGQAQNNPGTGANAITSGNVTTTQADELIVMGSGFWNVMAANDAAKLGTGFAYLDATPVTGVSGAYKIVSATGTYAGTWNTTDATDDFATRVATFKMAVPSTCRPGSLILMGVGC